jgi:pimeloyl-ACP methyl ester carboxylesterase
VLVHGLSGSRRWWRYTAPVLERQYRVHVPSLIGFGGAARRPDVPSIAGVIVEWMAQLEDVPYAVIGHSMGGQIALHVAAAQHTLQRLVLVAATGLPRPLTLRDAALLVASSIPPRQWGAPLFIPLRSQVAAPGTRALVHATRLLLRDDVRRLLPQITCPTLVVWGALDPLVPVAHATALQKGIEHARTVVFPDAGHNVMADKPAAFNRLVVDFLVR